MGKTQDLWAQLRKWIEQIEGSPPESGGAEALVRQWVSEYAQLLPEHRTKNPDTALQLLAAWGRLHRARKDLLSRFARLEPPPGVNLSRRWSDWLDLGPRAHTEEEGLHARKEELAHLATEAIRPLEWVQKVTEADEEDVDDERTWVELLDHLDRMEVGHWAATRVMEGAGQDTLSRKARLLPVAREALREHAVAFLPARKWVLAFVGAVDFEAGDEKLVATAEKAAPLLEEIVRFEKAEREPEGATDVVDDRMARIIKATALTAWRNRRLLDLLSKMRQLQSHAPVAVAADVPRALETIDLSELRWASPDGQYRAYVDLPPSLSGVASLDRLPVRLAHALRVGDMVIPGKPTNEFEGQILRLAGVAARVGRDGLVEFPVDELQSALERGEPAVLEIGEGADLQTWLPVLPRR